MIKLSRRSVTFPVSLDFTRANSAANNELRRNQALIDAHQPPDELNLKFTAYEQPSVRNSINELSNNRCAYCGAKPLRYKVEVEHYRPKNAVTISTGAKISPGYYWLAGVWDNLLPSCRLCNARQNSEVIENNSRVETTVGKGTLFHLTEENRVAPLTEGQEDGELPLLFNPCIDDPYDLFSYAEVRVENRAYLIITPNININDEAERQKAEHSISMLGLNHLETATKRLKVAIRCKAAINTLDELLASIEETSLIGPIYDLTEFISIKKDSSFIGLNRKLAADCIYSTRTHLVNIGEVDQRELPITLKDAISDLEEYCDGYVPPVSIGIIC